MDSTAMASLASALVDAGLRVARFEFEYMAARRIGSRKPPPRAELLKEEYCLAVAELKCSGPLIIGGKSMGARVASLVADALYADRAMTGLCQRRSKTRPLGGAKVGHLAPQAGNGGRA